MLPAENVRTIRADARRNRAQIMCGSIEQASRGAVTGHPGAAHQRAVIEVQRIRPARNEERRNRTVCVPQRTPVGHRKETGIHWPVDRTRGKLCECESWTTVHPPRANLKPADSYSVAGP